jgi:Arc/MetJ-type ribon-helix-helix transcriptional regulator
VEAKSATGPDHRRISFCYADRIAQLVTRIDDRLLAAIDDLVERGVVANRSEAVRRALEGFLDAERRASIAARIVQGYRRRPQTEDEVGWADEATVRMIAEEPW